MARRILIKFLGPRSFLRPPSSLPVNPSSAANTAGITQSEEWVPHPLASQYVFQSAAAASPLGVNSPLAANGQSKTTRRGFGSQYEYNSIQDLPNRYKRQPIRQREIDLIENGAASVDASEPTHEDPSNRKQSTRAGNKRPRTSRKEDRGDGDEHQDLTDHSDNDSEDINDEETLERMEKYSRGPRLDFHSVKGDKKVKNLIKRGEAKIKSAAKHAALAEILLTEESGYLEADEDSLERTYHFRQSDIQRQVDIASAQKAFQLDLSDKFGPYRVDYTRNGRHLLIGGRRGHVAACDWKTAKLNAELQLGETVRDVKWLHNETMFAVAQKKYVYVYDRTGLELHCMKNHIEVNRMEFLPYHFLLATVGNAGYLRYQDTSTGELVAELRTRLGRCDAMTQNPWNAILNLGHSNGTVTLWSPNVTQPLVKMLCHKGPVKALAVDPTGHYMTTSGLDGFLKIWDLRTYKLLNRYITPTPVNSISISQKGLVATAHGPNVTVWRDTFTCKQPRPYMSHLHPSSIVNHVKFCPFDDVMGYGHASGVASILIPGSGEANFDALELNPFQTTKQRREAEVRSLLDKIQPEMITLNPTNIARVDRTHKDVIAEERKLAFEANNPGQNYESTVNKARGKSSSKKRFLKKKANIIERNKQLIREKNLSNSAGESAGGKIESSGALDRFKIKSKQ